MSETRNFPIARSQSQWLKTSKIMKHVLSMMKNVVFDGLLVDGWPGTGDPWKDGDSASTVEFSIRYPETQGAEYLKIFGPNSTPIPWESMPMLLEFFKEHCLGDKNDDTDAEELRIQSTLPFAFIWADYGEDDDLEIRCCAYDEWKDTMNFKNDLLKDAFEYIVDGNDEVRYYVASYDVEKDTVRIWACGDDYDKFRRMISKRTAYHSSPMLLQACENEDDEECAICYWMVKNIELDELE